MIVGWINKEICIYSLCFTAWAKNGQLLRCARSLGNSTEKKTDEIIAILVAEAHV